jgi:regulator of protease activity HflC (stomatin/prohibitin superfamily)
MKKGRGKTMLALKFLLIAAGVLFIAAAFAITLYDLWMQMTYRRKLAGAAEGTPAPEEPEPVRWRAAVGLALLACLPLVVAESIVVIPAGMGGVRISQMRGTLPGTLYPGTHFITPLVESVQVFDLRDRLFTAGAVRGAQNAGQPLDVQSKEGLNIGLAITVRYRLDPRRLDYIQSHLPQPVDSGIVPAVVASAWRELTPNYTVREIFSSKREEVHNEAAATITKTLGADGILVEEVMLRNIELPPEYSAGLQDLLLKEQQDDQLSVQTDMQRKQVVIAELQAEAEARQKVKEAQGTAEARVVEAKGESDAMQYTLPLKQKEIEQAKLEAEAQKEATIENAQAAGEAKVIDSKAELQRRELLAQAEANRIRVTSAADEEEMAAEGKLLNQSPLLINQIIAQRLSDKIQLVMVPSDGKYFFANDLFRGLGGGLGGTPQSGATGGGGDSSSH